MPKRVSGDILKMPIERNPENMDVIDSELLMNFFKKRNIEYLYHFTPVANLYSIIKNGLLPVYELKKRNLEFINPDQNRLDFRTRGISLSISHTNNRLLYKNICNLKIPFVVIEIESRVLWEQSVVKEFFYTNAASNCFSPFFYYTEPSDLYKMFVAGSGIYPYDEQAEIIFYGSIPFKYMSTLLFKQESDIPADLRNMKEFCLINPHKFHCRESTNYIELR